MYMPGEFAATVIDQRLTKNTKGNYQLEFRCQLEDGQDRTIYLVLTEKTHEFTADLIADTFGVVPDQWTDLDASEDAPKCDVRGRLVTLYCKHEEYQGATKERWSFSNPNLGRKPLESNDKASLNAMFGASLSKAKARVGGTATKAPPRTKANTEGDDIPF